MDTSITLNAKKNRRILVLSVMVFINSGVVQEFWIPKKSKFLNLKSEYEFLADYPLSIPTNFRTLAINVSKIFTKNRKQSNLTNFSKCHLRVESTTFWYQFFLLLNVCTVQCMYIKVGETIKTHSIQFKRKY